jgi:transcriptional regulator of acetoin/glycerol metabolism
MRMLQAYDWPGNVRELFAVVESAAIRADEGRIEAHHLPQELRAKAGGWGTTSSGTGGYGVDSAGGYERAASAGEDERAAIVAALEAAGHNRTRAAAMLGMGRTTLWRKMRSYGIRAQIEGE